MFDRKLSVKDLDFQTLDEDFVNSNFDLLFDLGEFRRSLLGPLVRDGVAVVDESGRYIHIPEVENREHWLNEEATIYRMLYSRDSPGRILRSVGRTPMKERLTKYGRYYREAHLGMVREHEQHGRVLISLFV
jgi:hypothetical protein